MINDVNNGKSSGDEDEEEEEPKKGRGRPKKNRLVSDENKITYKNGVIFIDRECLDEENQSWNEESTGQKRSYKQMASEDAEGDLNFQMLQQCPESSNSNIENSNIQQNTRLKRQKV